MREFFKITSPKPPSSTHVRAWFNPFFLFLCAILLLCSVGAVHAATSTETATTTASPAQLADLLENEQTRQQLIEQLRGQVTEEPLTANTAEEAEAADSLPRRVADTTQVFLTKVIDDFDIAAETLGSIVSGKEVENTKMEGWQTVLLKFFFVVFATVIAFVLTRLIASRFFLGIEHWATHAPKLTQKHQRHAKEFVLLRKLVAIFGAFAIDVLAIALAAIVGYGVVMFLNETNGGIGVVESLFVNAFVVVEFARALVRLVFAPRYPHLRLFTMSDEVARYWNKWLSTLVTAVGYGMLVVVPIVSLLFSTALGNIIHLLIMFGVFIYAVRGILKHRVEVHDSFIRRANQSTVAFFGTLMRLFAKVWYILAIIYFTVLLVVSQIDPVNALPFMAHATMQSVVAIIIGLFVSTLLTAVLSRRIHLSDDLRAKLPMLEERINSYVPAMLKGLRILTLGVVLLVILDAWHAFDLSMWLSSTSGKATINMVVNVGIVLLIAALSWSVIASLIEGRLSGSGGHAPSAREKTLLSILRNAVLIVIITMTILVVLSEVGINIAPLLAGAGVVGLAIGFGAQKLVQDIITGVFIQLENGMNVNDVVEAGGVFGTVEKMTIRSVGIRTVDGGYHLIPFSSVDVVVNHMRDFSYHMGEYTIAHRENVDYAIEHLKYAFAELMEDEVLAPEILEEITIPGVTAISDKGVTIRVLIKTTPGMQWAVQRGYNRLVKKHFNAANIELPYPHTVVYFGQDRNGNAPAANVNFSRADKQRQTSMRRGNAPSAGHTPSYLTPAVQGSTDVLGNELELVVSDDEEEQEKGV
ncbi:MAG: mechanosensitive channel protein [Alcaligenaceae bacterium]|nr:mechanosensitive channel protein [Alcaligenaceae bacterium]